MLDKQWKCANSKRVFNFRSEADIVIDNTGSTWRSSFRRYYSRLHCLLHNLNSGFNTGSLLGCSVHYYWGCSRAGKKVLAHYSRESWICIAWHCEVYFIFKIRFSAVLDLNLCFIMTVNVFMCALSQNRGAVPDLRIETRPWIHISRLCKKYIYCHVFSYR